MQLLHSNALEKAILSLEGWHQRGYELVKAYPTHSHREAMLLVSEVGRVLSACEHTPAVDVSSPATTVYVAIHTPSHGGVTDEDVQLARRLDHALRNYLWPPDLVGVDAPGPHDELGGPDAPGARSVMPSDPEEPPGLRPKKSGM